MGEKSSDGFHELIQTGLIEVMENPAFKSFFVQIIRDEVIALEAAGMLHRKPHECTSASQS